MQKAVVFLQEYWMSVLAGLILIVAAILIQRSAGVDPDVAAEQRALEDEISDVRAELQKPALTEEALNQEVEVIKEAGASARSMGKELIESMSVLTKRYRSPLLGDVEIDEDELESAEFTYTELTGSTDYVNVWMLNPTWTMKLETVANYANTSTIPVVFSMYTEDGLLAGLVQGQYRTDANLLEDVQIQYTVDGQRDQIDIGGGGTDEGA